MAYSGAFRMQGNRPPEPDRARPEQSRPPAESRPPRREPDKLSGALGAVMKHLENVDLETDDLIMALILYLMYRESGDKDLLIMLGAMLLT